MRPLRSTVALVIAVIAATAAHADVSLSSVYIAFVVDPEGNRIELIQPARR